MTTHSQGPWHVSGSAVPIVYDSKGWAICNAITFHGKHRDGEPMANAHLIAASPDLLAACQLLIEQYESSGDFIMGGNLTNEPFFLAKAAIAAAKGG